MKDPRVEEPKARDSESSVSQRSNNKKSFEKAWKKKKKERHQKDQEHQKDSNPTTGVNTEQTEEPY